MKKPQVRSDDLADLANTVPTESGALYMPAATIGKPLHVQVAEALGWLDLKVPNGMWPDEFWGFHPEWAPIIGQRVPVPDYTTDWSATGPLIEKYGISIELSGGYGGCRTPACESCLNWTAQIDGPEEGIATSPLIAICRLILALKAAGKLDSVQPNSIP
jgi:hypothetical protein